MPTIEEILSEYPSLQNEKSAFIKGHLLEAMQKAKDSGRSEALKSLNGIEVQVYKTTERGQKPKFFLSKDFIDRLV